jgi:hypothetical protein
MKVIRSLAAVAALSFAGACGTNSAHVGSLPDVEDTAEAALTGPGAQATDARVPELGTNLNVLNQSKLSMAQGLAIAAQKGPVIEAKFEVGDDGKLSLSTYPVGKELGVDAERNVFRELAGDPTKTPFSGALETFSDREHLLRSARDLTLLQLSTRTLESVVAQASAEGKVFWAIPTIRGGRAGFGVYTWDGSHKRYHFYSGRGSTELTWYLQDLGRPGSAATDERTPELGTDLSVLKATKISMSKAIAKMEAEHGPVIEAKFELGEDGKLSLSVYPIGNGIARDAERNTFFEAAGDPTQTPWSPSLSEFKVPDAEHLTRSARDLTITQLASLELVEAVQWVEDAYPGSIVYWAIPAIRGTRPGYGVYAYDRYGKSHYFFIS